MNVACAILAAGKSERFGSPKALALWRGKPFAQHIAEQAERAGLSPLLLVLGHDWQSIRRHLSSLRVEFVVNHDFERGQFSSLQKALARLRGACRGAVVCLVDQPQVTAEVLAMVARELEAEPNTLIVPTVAGRGVHPVGIGAAWFDAILQMSPASTLREFFRQHSAWLRRPAVHDPVLRLDVDTPDDLQALEAAVRGRGGLHDQERL